MADVQRKSFKSKKANAWALLLTLLFVCPEGQSVHAAGQDSLRFWMESWIPCDSGWVAAFVRAADGYVFLVNSVDAEKRHVRIIRVRENGQILWNRMLGRDKNYIGSDVKPRFRGGYIVCGSAAEHFESPDFWLTALDNDGQVIWEKEWGGAGSQGLNAVVDNAGDLTIAGWAQNENRDDAEMYLAMTDMNGTIRWTRTYGGPQAQQFFAVCISRGNTIVAAGQAAAENRSETEITVVKTDANGEMMWRQNYRSDEPAWIRKIEPTADKGFIMAASLLSESGGRFQGDCGVHFIKTGEQGELQWDRRQWLKGNCCDGITLRPDQNGYVVGAFAIACDTSHRDLQILRVDQLGEPLWQTFYSGIGYSYWKNEWGNFFSRTADPLEKGLRILFGESVGEFRLTVRDARLMGRKKDKWVSFVSFELPKMCPMRLLVSDIHGQRVDTVLDVNCSPGRHSRWWDATNQPDGLYIARLETPTGTIIRKFVVMK